MNTIAIITARGGSKRIPGKNIKEFCGKPILSYSIKAALDSKIFDTVMVSTDDEKIADIAVRYGAEVPFFRSAETSDDFATTGDVIMEVLEEYEKRKRLFDLAACIYPTAPFITSDKLKTAVELLKDSDADTVIPVVGFSYPPQRALHEVNGILEPVYPENMNMRSQDLEKHYHDVGQFYFFRTDRFKLNKSLMSGKVLPLFISELEMQDIDNVIDWKMAELKYRLLINEGIIKNA